MKEMRNFTRYNTIPGMKVSDLNVAFNFRDNGGRRSVNKRRKFYYTQHIPERRRCQDRRIGKDRRSAIHCERSL